MKKYSHTGKLCIFNMESGAWRYIPVPLDKILKIEKKRGWGSVPIIASVGGSSWPTSIFPMKKDNYFIPIKKKVFINEDLEIGEEFTVSYTVDNTRL